MKRILTLMVCGMLMIGSTTLTVNAASSLDDVVSANTETTNTNTTQTTETVNNTEATAPATTDTAPATTETAPATEEKKQDTQNIVVDASEGNFIDVMKDATDLTQTSESVKNINKGINKGVGMVVQVLAYVATALLALRVAADVLYIAVPFLRKILGNGYVGNPGVGAQNQGMNGMQGGMGGMGMNGMGGGFGSPMGGMGMGGMSGMGGFGRSGYGMGGMGIGGMSGMGMQGMGGMQGGMQGQAQPWYKIQLVSNAALNAVAAEQNGMNAFKIYAKDMFVVLVVTPIFLVLAITGALSNLGFAIGDIAVEIIRKLISMM